jgi:hypothetical protein
LEFAFVVPKDPVTPSHRVFSLALQPPLSPGGSAIVLFICFPQFSTCFTRFASEKLDCHCKIR